jgi:hypothetical protein
LSTAADTLLSNAYFKHAGERSNVTSPSLAATPVRERTRVVTPVPASAVRADPAFGAPAPPGGEPPHVVRVGGETPTRESSEPILRLLEVVDDAVAGSGTDTVGGAGADTGTGTGTGSGAGTGAGADAGAGADTGADSGPGSAAGAGRRAGEVGLLPDPRPLAETLARCVVEVLAGTRDIDQIARWLSTDVHAHLMKRVVLARRARALRDESPGRFAFTMGSTVLCEPSDGVVEAVVIVHGRARSRAVALRLEALGPRWRASAVHVL